MADAWVALAGLMGAAGVGMLAADAHLAGGELARTGGLMLLIHAVVVLAVGAATFGGRRLPRGLEFSAGLLALGAVLFGAELGFAGFVGTRPIPLAAPVGGLCMIGGWLGFAGVGLVRMVRARGERP